MGTFLESFVGLIAGGVIGCAFGMAQRAALLHNQKLEQRGDFKSGWKVMPGSGGRVALLMLTLILIQVICPILFTGGTQWWVSGGLLAGYGLMLYQQLRIRQTGRP